MLLCILFIFEKAKGYFLKNKKYTGITNSGDSVTRLPHTKHQNVSETSECGMVVCKETDIPGEK